MIYLRLVMANIKAVGLVVVALVFIFLGWRYKTALRENGRYKARESLGHKLKDIRAAREKKIKEVRGVDKETLIDELNNMSR